MTPWIPIIALVIEAIVECLKNRKREDIVAGLMNPGLRETWALRRILRKEEGLRGQELREKVWEGLQFLSEMPSGEVEEMMCEAEDFIVNPTI